MSDTQRNEILALINKIYAGKYKCGMAADTAIRALWEENIALRARIEVLENAVEWALGQADCFNEKIMIELRRRAGVKE